MSAVDLGSMDPTVQLLEKNQALKDELRSVYEQVQDAAKIIALLCMREENNTITITRQEMVIADLTGTLERSITEGEDSMTLRYIPPAKEE